MTDPIKLNILGTTWKLYFTNEDKDPKMKDIDGYADHSIKTIFVEDFTGSKAKDSMLISDIETYKKQVMRHEIIHAFLYESGFNGNEYGLEHWTQNEEMVDWFAIQFPKIVEVFREAGCL